MDQTFEERVGWFMDQAEQTEFSLNAERPSTEVNWAEYRGSQPWEISEDELSDEYEPEPGSLLALLDELDPSEVVEARRQEHRERAARLRQLTPEQRTQLAQQELAEAFTRHNPELAAHLLGARWLRSFGSDALGPAPWALFYVWHCSVDKGGQAAHLP